MKEATLGLVVVALLFCSGVAGQSLPTAVSYPSQDPGWTHVGSVQPEGCAGGGCTYNLPDVSGNLTAYQRTIGDSTKEEYYDDEVFFVQNNGQNSYANLLVNVPSTQNYKIAIGGVVGQQYNAPLGGQFVYPVMQIVVNGSPANICKYPGNTAITATTYLTVNNPKGVVGEYAESCALQLFAGNNNVAIQIVGGQAHGGLLAVRHLLIYPSSGVAGHVSCYNGTAFHFSTQTGADLFSMQTNAQSWHNSQSCTTPTWVSLRDAGYFYWGAGCNNGTAVCALTQMD